MGPSLRNHTAMAPLTAMEQPFLLFLSHSLTVHLTPTIRVAEALRSWGWPVFFLGPSAHRTRIVNTGVEFIPLTGEADLDDLQYYSANNPNPPAPDYWNMTWQERAVVDIKVSWLEPIPAQWEAVKAALTMLHTRDPGGQVIIVTEAIFHGILLLFYGAPLPAGIKRPKTAALSVTICSTRSWERPDRPRRQTQSSPQGSTICLTIQLCNLVYQASSTRGVTGRRTSSS